MDHRAALPAAAQKGTPYPEHLGNLIGLRRQQVSKVERCRVRLHPRSWEQFRELELTHRQPNINLPTRWE
jgi:hypothetical protein